MSIVNQKKAIFVSSRVFLGNSGGGVQWCTREYLDTINAAGISTAVISYDAPQDFLTRLVRKLFPAPYRGLHYSGLVQEILTAADREGSNLIFLNNTDAASLAPALLAFRKNLRLIFLSHGVEITDVVNNLRIAPETIPSYQKHSSWLGELLKTEIDIRESLDCVLCISEEDVAFEQWLGSQHVKFIPRQIHSDPLEFNPIKGRIGTVGTLDHGPNLHGLRLLAEALSGDASVDLRVVGGPEKVGLALQHEFKAITYLGRLSDKELKKEAATWCAFVNPIFCHARGASTKIATALGWGLPVLTTKMGARGYCWNNELMPLSNSPKDLANYCKQLVETDDLVYWFQKADQLAHLAPNEDQSGELLRSILISLNEH